MYESAEDGLHELPAAFVSISTLGGELLATTRTDANGRYQLVNLPEDRLAVSASKPGYIARRAGGRDATRVVLDCTVTCTGADLDFELARGVVLTGVVLDELREPAPRATVTLRPTGSSGAEQKLSAATDDRGRFRIAGLVPGAYLLTIQHRGPDARTRTVTREVSIAEGQDRLDLPVALGAQESFRLAGRLAGVPYGEGYRTWISLHALGEEGRGWDAAVDADGRFQFESLPAGRYAAAAAVVRRDTVERTDQFLDVIDLDRDTGELLLQPVAPAAIAGVAQVVAGKLPPGATIRFTSIEGFGYRWTRTRGAENRFELDGLRPGTYRVTANSGQFYVRGIKNGERVVSPAEVRLASGPNDVSLVVAADFSEVHGLVRGSANQPLPNARVALRGELAEYTIQADQTGRFQFERVIPGDYRICAWKDLAPGRVDDQVSWEQAGCQSLVLPIQPFSKSEIDVGAAP